MRLIDIFKRILDSNNNHPPVDSFEEVDDVEEVPEFDEIDENEMNNRMSLHNNFASNDYCSPLVSLHLPCRMFPFLNLLLGDALSVKTTPAGSPQFLISLDNIH